MNELSTWTSTDRVKTLLTGLAMGESPRWHDGRLWMSDWGAQEIIAVDLDGTSEVSVRTSFGLPFCIDWLHDGRMLIVSGREGLLLRREIDGSLVTHADLRGLAGQLFGTRWFARRFVLDDWFFHAQQPPLNADETLARRSPDTAPAANVSP